MLTLIFASTDQSERMSGLGLGFAGAIVGQVLFGWLADKRDRKKMYGIELMIILFGTMGQALSAQGSGLPVLLPIIFWLVMMGIGIGGDYPLSSIITSEFASGAARS